MAALRDLLCLGDAAKLVLREYTTSTVRPPFVEVLIATTEDGHLVTGDELLTEIRLRNPGYGADIRRIRIELAGCSGGYSRFVVSGIGKKLPAVPEPTIADYREIGGC